MEKLTKICVAQKEVKRKNLYKIVDTVVQLYIILWEQIMVYQSTVALIAPLTSTKSTPPKTVDPLRFWKV